MSDLERTRAALRRAAMDGPGEALRAGDGGALARVLRQIDLSVLGRQVTLATDDGVIARFDAADRRLLRFTEAGRGAGRTAPEVFERTTLGADDLAAVVAELQAMVQDADDLRISAVAVPGLADVTAGGLTAQALMQAAGLETTPVAARALIDAIEHFLADPALDTRTAIWIEGDTGHIIAGANDEAEALTEWGEDTLNLLLADDFPLAGSLETDGAMVFALTDGAQAHALIAGRLGQFFVARVAGNDAAGTLMAWRAAHR